MKVMKKKIIIVGGGFAGIQAAKTFCHSKSDIEVILIDRRNHHLFQPLLYQVAMAGLASTDISVPIRSVLSECSCIQVLLGNVTAVDLKTKTLTTDFQNFSYDYLVLACGSKQSYFGHKEWENFAPGLKSIEEAVEIRRRVLLAFELAEREKNLEKQKQLLTFIIVGGGPTGVELAGALGEISRYTLNYEFRNIDPRRTKVVLIEAGARILSAYSEDLSNKATRALEKIGVQVWTASRVQEISEKGVKVGNEFLEASTVLWAAGVEPSSLNRMLSVPLDQQGRVMVGEDLSIPGHAEVFVLGDQANFSHGSEALPGLAPVAIQQGRKAAENILADLRGKAREHFRYVDKGMMSTIGRSSAVAKIKSYEFAGFFAWILWLVVHIYYLIGFKNRLFVLFQWAWAYLTWKRGARIITSRDWHSL